MTVKDGRAYLTFTHTGSGLMAKDNGELRGFAIAGADRKFTWAQAKIEGDKLVVWNDEIKEPAAVRYGWEDNPDCTLYNREGLPASPFTAKRSCTMQ
jgi:sialate O-acetylesterase